MKIRLVFIGLYIILLTGGCHPNGSENYLNDLRSKNVMVRNRAIYYLGKNKDKRAVPLLTKLMNDSQTKETRLRITEALGKIGGTESVDALIGLLQEEDKLIRNGAIEALGMVKDKKAVMPLISHLENQDDRLAVLWALGNIGDERAIPALSKLLSHKDEYIVYNAAQALKRIGTGR